MIKKLYLVLFVLFSSKLSAQTTLNFNKRFVQCEDKWVAFKPIKDSVYAFGFIYIDEKAGLTLNYEGTFNITSSGIYVPQKIDTTSLKVRLEPNNVLVALIPENKFRELNISAIPEWLSVYKRDTNSIQRLYKWGFMYNGWQECAKALTFLERAEKINRNYPGLAVELSFSYNCLEQYDKAEAILEEEIKLNAGDAYVNKEYIYTLVKNYKIDKAVVQFESSLKNLNDKQYHAENCYNIMQYFYTQNDKANFNKWYKILQKQPNENNTITNNANFMKRQMK